jgi:hypothetical protein
MTLKKTAVNLYITNLALLVTHEIDSAYWHEWKLFNLPGGIDLFLILNFILIIIFLFGLPRIIEWKKYADYFYLLLAFSGIFAFIIHTYFIYAGHPEFNTMVSWAILVLTFIFSVLQLSVFFLIKKS